MLTKEKERDVFVKDLSLWDCQDEKSIFRKFISSIFDQLKIGYSDWEIERYVERCLNKAFDSQKIPLSLPVSDGGDGEDEITEQANRYLANNKKRLVVVIDDFDRMEPKYVLFVYKAVASVLRFENVTYVLCYDEQRVSEAFLSLRVPFDYLNKIVSMHISIQMPSPSEMSKTYLICLSHFLASSKRFKKQKDDDEMAKLANDCARYCQTIREFELFINRIWFLAFSDSPLDFYDDLRLALLHLINPGVWYEIKNNYQYFVRDHTVDDPFMGSVLQNDSGGIDSGQYFAEFNKKYGPNLNQLLYELFPNLATSLPVNNFEINEENKGKQLLLPRANNDFFISLFFTQCDNEYKSALTDLNLLFGNPNSPLTSASLDSFYQKNGAFGIAILLDFISYQKSDYGFYETAIWSLNAPKVNLESLTLLTRRSLFSECFQAISDQAKKEALITALSSKFDDVFEFVRDLEYEILLGNVKVLACKAFFTKTFENYSDGIAQSDPEKYLRDPFSYFKYRFVYEHSNKGKARFTSILGPKCVFRLIYTLCDITVGDPLTPGAAKSEKLTLTSAALQPFSMAINFALAQTKNQTDLQQKIVGLYKDAQLHTKAELIIGLPVHYGDL